ncbi:hypothetical protein SAY87_008574 [Trapa incisa]|uniref:Uncharacterized protein n=1 Tax=Trapa incisa TaxID=236973 RepID=A0AAN7PV79_9MYRT|nr:hypothetical protein SAY87_008574 [Trapa incisa]
MATMSSAVCQTIHKKRASFSFTTSAPSLPLSSSDSSSSTAGLRRRLSSISLPLPTSFGASWALHRSKSLPTIGSQTCSSIKGWWDGALAWVLSRKPAFAQDLEMNEEETKLLGSQGRGSWRHVFYKVRSEIRKLIGSNQVGLPQTCRYDSFSYNKNFDDGKARFYS